MNTTQPLSAASSEVMCKVFLGLVLLATPGLITSCTDEPISFTPDCSTSYSFADDVSPIISASCATASSCHASGSRQGPGELTTYSQVFGARNSIRSAVSSGQMPKSGTLSSAQKNAVICWIDNGGISN